MANKNLVYGGVILAALGLALFLLFGGQDQASSARASGPRAAGSAGAVADADGSELPSKRSPVPGGSSSTSSRLDAAAAPADEAAEAEPEVESRPDGKAGNSKPRIRKPRSKDKAGQPAEEEAPPEKKKELHRPF